MLVTTVLFVCVHLAASLHAPGPAEVVRLFKVYFPPLLVLALVRQYTGSLLAAIMLYVLDNATIFFTAATG
jgi:membrane protease YdiL (CAAX protease family)